VVVRSVLLDAVEDCAEDDEEDDCVTVVVLGTVLEANSVVARVS